MKIHAYLNFPGTCEQAMTHYAKVLGGQVVAMLPYAGSPMAEEEECAFPDGYDGKIMHACVMVGDQILMASDAPTDRFERPQGFAVSLLVDTPAEGERIFNALAEGGSVLMPYQPTFWASGFGMVTDRFGTPWMINCEQAA